MSEKPVVCVDFDGVLNDYAGWRGPNYMYSPRPGVAEFMFALQQDYTVAIFSTRDPGRLRIWLDYYLIPYDKIVIRKVPAVAYIDDRALKFNGNYMKTLKELSEFKTHWEKHEDDSCDDDCMDVDVVFHIIKEAIRHERTDMGRNVLIQLAESLNIEGY